MPGDAAERPAAPLPDTPGFEIAAVMEPAREVGGDFYDIFRIDAHRVGIAVADVRVRASRPPSSC
ncbi:MAG: hypothetical protein R3D28_20215 [Geminicoccaceae bacterium]